MKMKRSLSPLRYGRHPADAFSDNVAERKSRANGICAVSSGCTEMSSCCGSVIAFFRASRGQEQLGGEKECPVSWNSRACGKDHI